MLGVNMRVVGQKSAEELDDLVDDVVSGAPEAAEPVPSL